MDPCYLNGEILAYEDCRLHISDLQFQRGYGVFDFFRSRNGQIPWLEDYRERLFNSVRLSGMETGISQAEFKSVIGRLHELNKDGVRAFKVMVTGGYSENLATKTGPENLVILNRPWNAPSPDSILHGVNLISHEYARPNPEIKTLFYFNTLQLRYRLREYQAVDVLYHTGQITEASRANLFFIKQGTVYTPGANILNGITRKHILGLFPEIRTGPIAFENLFGYDELFMCSTSRDISPVVSVDGKKIGNGKPGPVTGDILQAFRARGW